MASKKPSGAKFRKKEKCTEMNHNYREDYSFCHKPQYSDY